MNTNAVVDALIGHLRKTGHPDLVLDRRPDEINRSSSDIDAVAGVFAIEHTSIDSIPNQRRDDSRFSAVVGELLNKYQSGMSFRLRVGMDNDAIRVGQDWDRVRSGLDRWIAIEAPRLPDGLRHLESIPDVPFPLTIEKQSGRAPGLVIGRFSSCDDGFVGRLEAAMRRKAAKLAPYQTTHTTLLLIESQDVSFMNEAIMADAIAKVLSREKLHGVSSIWFADTSTGEQPEFVEMWHDRGVA